MSLDDLPGVWHPVGIYSEDTRGRRHYHFGEDAIGRLTCHAEGYMNAFISRRHRPPFANGTTDDGSADEIAQAFVDFDACSGRFSVDFEGRTVTHPIDMARSPAWIGKDLERYFEFRDGRLAIQAPPSRVADEERVIRVEWERRATPP